jgi:transposase-like protein
MTGPGRYPPELRERAVRLVFEHPSQVGGDHLHCAQVRDLR